MSRKQSESHGERLRHLALRKGLSPTALARRAHVGSAVLARINRGEEVQAEVWARLLKTADGIPDLPYADEVLAG